MFNEVSDSLFINVPVLTAISPDSAVYGFTKHVDDLG